MRLAALALSAAATIASGTEAVEKKDDLPSWVQTGFMGMFCFSMWLNQRDANKQMVNQGRNIGKILEHMRISKSGPVRVPTRNDAIPEEES